METTTLREICTGQTSLPEPDICRLEAIAEQLPLMAELSGDDVFLDCLTEWGAGVVAAQACPAQLDSLYSQCVVGKAVLQENEPAVFRAMRERAPVRDLKAITQEGRTVRQDVVPVFNAGGCCIAALIREKDVSEDLLREKKFEELAKSYEQENPPLRSEGQENCDSLVLREIHHRVKNNLQMIASILNLQARRCESETARAILQENVGRVLSIAAIHDILLETQEHSRDVDSIQLLTVLQKHLRSLTPDGKQISIHASGDHVLLPSDMAASVALVVNELVTNALTHGFREKDRGSIQISFCRGALFHTLSVTDNGDGFGPDAAEGLGLRIVRATVREKLHGHVTVRSDALGSTVSFEIKTE